MNAPPSASQPSDSPDDRTDGSDAESAAKPREQGHFGPLTLERMRKEDGRLLIVFRESREDQR
jgi:hypothetical protein